MIPESAWFDCPHCQSTFIAYTTGRVICLICGHRADVGPAHCDCVFCVATNRAIRYRIVTEPQGERRN